MPLLNTITRVAAKPLPRMVSPKGHAVIDYLTVATFLMGAGMFWGRSKRAALAALICGGAELAVNLLTDYPGGARKVISFRAHREIDFGLAAMTATMPEVLAFQDEGEKKFFVAQGALITVANQITKFPEKPVRAEKGRRLAKVI